MGRELAITRADRQISVAIDFLLKSIVFVKSNFMKNKRNRTYCLVFLCVTSTPLQHSIALCTRYILYITVHRTTA